MSAALHVLSSEGEKLPWILLLQPEATDTDRQGCESTDTAGNVVETPVRPQTQAGQCSETTDTGQGRRSEHNLLGIRT